MEPAGVPISRRMLWMLLKLWHHRKQSAIGTVLSR
jgi:hypothetical protein